MNRISAPLIAIVEPVPGEPDPAVRLRRWLKVGLRTFGVRVAWAPSDPHDLTTLSRQQTPAPEGQHE